MRKIEISTERDASCESAKKLAIKAAQDLGGEVTLLSYYYKINDVMVPRATCEGREEDGYRVYAESRGADMRVVVNGGEYDFFFKMTPDDTIEPEVDHANVVGAVGVKPGDDFGTIIGG